MVSNLCSSISLRSICVHQFVYNRLITSKLDWCALIMCVKFNCIDLFMSSLSTLICLIWIVYIMNQVCLYVCIMNLFVYHCEYVCIWNQVLVLNWIFHNANRTSIKLQVEVFFPIEPCYGWSFCHTRFQCSSSHDSRPFFPPPFFPSNYDVLNENLKHDEHVMSLMNILAP